MAKYARIFVAFMLLVGIFKFMELSVFNKMSGAPPNGVSESEVPLDPFAWIYTWKRPASPPRVVLQVGHLKNNEVPEELENLKDNTGTSSAGITEVETNSKIAEETARILRNAGILVEILPTTIPPRTWADAFVAIHADGNLDKSVRGFKVAPPWRDFSGKSGKLSEIIEREYGNITKLQVDANITRNMRGYYAFNFWKYEHSLNPMTPSVILETGFLTNYNDRKIITGTPSLPAEAISNAVLTFLKHEEII